MNRKERRALARQPGGGKGGIDKALALLADARRRGTLGDGDAPVTACPWCDVPLTDKALRFSEHTSTCQFAAFARRQGAIR